MADTLVKHPAPHLQKAVSQGFRAEQARTGDAVAEAIRRVWNAGFQIKTSWQSWALIRPVVVKIVSRYYTASQASGEHYYNTCRLTHGLGPLPASIKVSAPLTPDHMEQVIDSCSIGWFWHEVNGGARMMEAYASAREKLATAIDTLVLAGARDWIEIAAKADPESDGVRRVTSGTCGYCESLADMGVNVPDGGWHNDCECTSEPTFNGDTGPSPSLPDSGVGDEGESTDGFVSDFPEGSLGIDDSQWNNTMEYIGNSLKSGNLKDAQAYLNPDGSLNEGKAIFKLINDAKEDKPYSLSASGKPLNKTQSKLLDKFFTKLNGQGKKAVKSFTKAAEDAAKSGESDAAEATSPLDEAQKAYDMAKAEWKKSLDAYMKSPPEAKWQDVLDAKDKEQNAVDELIQLKENIETEKAAAKKEFDEWQEAKDAVQKEYGAANKSLQDASGKIKPAAATKGTPLSDAETKALDNAIKGWKTGNQAARKDMQHKILQYLTGQGDNLPADIKAVGRAFQEQSTDAPKLFRGLSWNLDDSYDKAAWDQMKTILDAGKGGKFDLPPSSFSEAEEWPEKFMAMKSSGSNTRQMKIILQDGSRGLNIEDLGVSQGEDEWLSGGRFEVVAMGKHGNSFNLVIRQVQGLDKPFALKKPESAAFISAIESWKGSSSVLSRQITRILQGEPSADSQANTIVNYIRSNTEDAPTLWRGLKFYNYGSPNEQDVAFNEATQVGKVVDLPASSFSQAKSVSVKFAGGNDTGISASISKYLIKVINGQGVNITKTGGTFLNEQEWISGGRFEVLSREQDDSGIIVITVRQLATLAQ